MKLWASKSPLVWLAESFAQLLWEDGVTLDMTSKEGRKACEKLLADLSAAVVPLEVPVQPREYRRQFSLNYWKLFGGVDEHNYHVDVLKAAMEWTESLYVNGEKFEFSEKAGAAARALLKQWLALTDPLKRNSFRNRTICAGHVSKHELRDCLEQFDVAWINFEGMYISELMKIEEYSRAPILKAMKEEAKLRALEERSQGPQGVVQGPMELLANKEYLQACDAMMSQLGRINAVANRVGKGRDDLDAKILRAIARELDDDGLPRDNVKRAFAEAAARRGYDSWIQIREYLQTMSSKIDRVDPQFSNNAGLVKALVAWESDWAFAKRFLLDETMCDDMCLIIHNMEDALQSLPCLQQRIDECDVELFMIIPRVVLIHFLLDPACRKAAIESMLPEFLASAECARLCSQFDALGSSVLTELGIPDVASPCGRARRMDLMWRLFLEVFEMEARCAPHEHIADGVHKAVKEFLHILEPWSVMLQRSNTEDWNCYCQAIIDNLMEEEDD